MRKNMGKKMNLANQTIFGPSTIKMGLFDKNTHLKITAVHSSVWEKRLLPGLL